jgi:WD40 repeat protein
LNSASDKKLTEMPTSSAFMVIRPDGRLVACGKDDDPTIFLIELESGRVTVTEQENDKSNRPDWNEGLAFSPDGRTLARGRNDNIVELLDSETGKLRSTIRICEKKGQHAEGVVAFSFDGLILATGAADDCKLKLWDAVTGGVVKALKANVDDASSIAFSRDGKFLAAGSSGDATVTL